jgi:glycosyltransferase involved in cell wall biosynthesis
MCVYNGERYLREQLASIAGQTELPHRMVVVDDGSDDGSWELLQQWASEAPFPVRLLRNAQRLGVVKNFEKAAGLLLDEVDVVFFSDQDDAWLPGKLAAFVDAFADDPRLGLVHCDAELVDGAGVPLGRTLLQALLLKDRERSDIATGRPYRSYAARNLVTGAACACRSTVLARALPFPQDWIHDDWVAATAVLVSRVKLLDRPWMRYRLHGQNTVGLPVPTLGWRLSKVVDLVFDDHGPAWERRLARVERMRGHALALGAPGEILEALDRAVAHARHRSSLPRGFFRRAAAVAAQCRSGSYREWSSGGISVVRDLLIAR